MPGNPFQFPPPLGVRCEEQEIEAIGWGKISAWGRVRDGKERWWAMGLAGNLPAAQPHVQPSWAPNND